MIDKSKSRSRSADATIRGFEYQFLSTQKQILQKIKANSRVDFVIEGIEDLDIKSTNRELQQYKYYEHTAVTFSTIQKPVAYMYCYWKTHKMEKIIYHLFMYSTQIKMEPKTPEDIKRILNLSGAKQIIFSQLNEDSVQSAEVVEFTKHFLFEQVESMQSVKKSVVSLISNVLHKPNQISEDFYLPLISEYIHSIAIKRRKEDRTISVKRFLDHIRKIDNVIATNIIYGSIDEKSLVTEFIDQMKSVRQSDTHEFNYVLRFGAIWSNRITAELLTNIAALFAYSGNRITNQPVTFLLDFEQPQLLDLKKNILNCINKKPRVIMNDGYESISFNKEVFGVMPFFSKNRNGVKYEQLSFNFRLASNENGFGALPNSDNFILNFDFDCDDSNNSVSFTGFQAGFVARLMKGLAKQ